MSYAIGLLLAYLIIKAIMDSDRQPRKRRTRRDHYSEDRWDLSNLTKNEQRDLFNDLKDRWGW